MIKYLLSVVLLLQIGILFSQNNLALGEWKSHLAYKEGKWLTQSNNKIIYASQRGMFTVDIDDLSVEFFAKEDGLSDVNISKLYFDKFNEQLIIVYEDNNIDILKGNDFINIPFIKTTNNILGSKTINDFYVSNEDFAYLATDFGVLGFNLKKLEFSFTTFTNLKVNEIILHENHLYAGTEEGLYKVSASGVNVSDFNIWQSLANNVGLPQSFEVKSLASKNGKLYALIDNKVYFKNTLGNFEVLYTAPTNTDVIKFISEEGSDLMLGVETIQNRSSVVFINAAHEKTIGGADCINRVAYALEDKNGKIWYADSWDPIRYSDNKSTGCHKLKFDVPFANTAGEVSFKKNDVFISSGGVTDDYQYANTITGFYIFDKDGWKNYNLDNVPLMSSQQIFNVQAIAPHPKNNDVYIGSYWNGIMKYNTESKEAKVWNKDNSILQGIVGDEGRTRISSLIFDDDENLWISNYGAPKPLAVKTKDDIWYNFSVPSNTSLADIAIDNQGNKWIAVVGVGNGILVYHEGKNIADVSDDKSRYITRNNSEIAGNKVNCVVVDLEGSVWVGTSQGPVVFDCGDPFLEICRGNTRKVVVDNIPALLLKDEDILSIEVDGANRKWFGTRNGIFVQSPDGTIQQMKFDVKNSPLLDNKVTDLSYNSLSGEMYITSAGGIQSYKTQTTGGGNTHSLNVYAYPNPVRPEYHGDIAIKGLVRDANVKITDINGHLIFETKALGGQAIWDGKDYLGNKASTGVYLVFSASENTSRAPESLVTKILIVN